MGHVALGDGRLMSERSGVSWKSHLASLVIHWTSFMESGTKNPSGRQALGITKTSTRSDECSEDDKQGSKKMKACSAGRPNPICPLVTSKPLAGAGDRGPPPFEAPCAGSLFVKGFQLVLRHMVNSASVACRETRQNALLFHSGSPPSMSIQDYLDRIRKYFRCCDECFVVALIYIDRVAKAECGVALTAFNAHRLLLAAVVLAAKFQDDVHYANAYYARVGGLPVSEVNLLEMHFLKMLSWNLFVGPSPRLTIWHIMGSRACCGHGRNQLHHLVGGGWLS